MDRFFQVIVLLGRIVVSTRTLIDSTEKLLTVLGVNDEIIDILDAGRPD